MRIGSLTSVNIEQWTPQYQRTTVQKQVPGFIVAQTYDVVARNNVLTIRGYLSGSSSSDLATRAMTLRGYVSQKKVIWIDASDQYQGYCELVRILELDGPNLDASKGVLTADFTLKCAMLLPWGTTFTNPFRQTGIVLRDLNGQGLEYILNPLEMNCNFQINNPNSSSENFSWEFILDNQNAFTNATSLQLADCASLGTGTASKTNPIATNNPRSADAAYDSISIDTANYPESSSGSLAGTVATPVGSAAYAMGYDFGTTGLDLSNYDRIRVWTRTDHPTQASYLVQMYDTSGNYRTWAFTPQAGNIWMNLEFDISTYTTDSGLILTAIQYIEIVFQMNASPPATAFNAWFGDIRAEVGYFNHCFDTNGATSAIGTGDTFSNDTKIYKQSPQLSSYTTENWSASLKQSGTSDSSGRLGFYYNTLVNGWDWSSYDFLVVWVRSDFGGNATGGFQIIPEEDGSDYFIFTYNSLNANQWYRLVIPLRYPTSTTGTPSLTNITRLIIRSISGSVTATTNLWVDEIALDVGQWTTLEMMLPDNMPQGTVNALGYYTWNGSTYVLSERIREDTTVGGTDAYSLDGTAFGLIYSTGVGTNQYLSQGIYLDNSINLQPSYYYSNSHAPSITYQPLWGTNNRFALSLKMPPATSDSISGNLPSNDLSGFQAISKVRLKVLVYCSNEDTTFEGN